VCRFPLAEALRHYRRELLTVIGLLWLMSAAFYIVFVYMTTYLSDVITARMPLHSALTINTLSMVVLAVLNPVMGALSDRFGRRAPQLLAATGFLALSYPLFGLLAEGDFTKCLLAQCVFAVLLAALTGPLPTMLVEIFSTRARYTALSLGYNVALAVFGGGAPLVATYLIHATGNVLAPGLYLTLSAAITLGVLWNVRETYREPLR
jgi:MHS family proline/betaine transporter-like MFS transporter